MHRKRSTSLEEKTSNTSSQGTNTRELFRRLSNERFPTLHEVLPTFSDKELEDLKKQLPLLMAASSEENQAQSCPSESAEKVEQAGTQTSPKRQ